MSRVLIVQLGSSIVKVCEDRYAFEDWFDRYGSESYNRDELSLKSTRVYHTGSEHK